MTPEKIILPNETPEARLRYLEMSSDSKIKKKYFIRLDEQEITDRRAKFTENALGIDDLELQRKETIAEFKQMIKPLREANKKLGQEIRTGFSETEGDLYLIVDRMTRKVYAYNSNGELIEGETRPATIEELVQLTIAHSRRTGLNN